MRSISFAVSLMVACLLLGCDSSSIHEAVEHGDLSRVEYLLEHGEDPDALNENNIAALHLASCDGKLPIAKALIAAGANVDLVSHPSVSPMGGAALYGHLDVVEELLDAGASIEYRTPDGRFSSALAFAVTTSRVEIVDYLLEHGAVVEGIEDGYGNTLLHTAAFRGEPAMLRMILAKFPEALGETNDEGDTPLEKARKAGNTAAIEILETAPNHRLQLTGDARDGQ